METWYIDILMWRKPSPIVWSETTAVFVERSRPFYPWKLGANDVNSHVLKFKRRLNHSWGRAPESIWPLFKVWEVVPTIIAALNQCEIECDSRQESIFAEPWALIWQRNFIWQNFREMPAFWVDMVFVQGQLEWAGHSRDWLISISKNNVGHFYL